MKRPTHDFDDLVARATSSIRHDVPDDAAVRESTSRVWSSLVATRTPAAKSAEQSDRIQGCGDFRSLIPALLDGSLSSGRAILFEDHTRECLPCRKALRAARSGESPNPKLSKPVTTRFQSRRAPMARRAIAAALVLGFGVLPVAL
jgi:hypothetical protein